jgi:hypothetical protein
MFVTGVLYWLYVVYSDEISPRAILGVLVVMYVCVFHLDHRDTLSYGVFGWCVT